MLIACLGVDGWAVFQAHLGDETLSRACALSRYICNDDEPLRDFAKCTAPQFEPLKLIELSTTKRIRQVFLTPYQVLGLKLP